MGFEDFAGAVGGGGEDVEESADAFGAEDDASGIGIGFDAEIEGGGGEELFDVEGVAEALGDVDEYGVVAVEK